MIFIDTGAFLGRYLPDDQYHVQALAGWEQLVENRLSCCTSNLVLGGAGGRLSGGEVGLPVQRDGKVLPCGIFGRWEAGTP